MRAVLSPGESADLLKPTPLSRGSGRGGDQRGPHQLSPPRGPHRLLGRPELIRRASPGPTETRSGRRPRQESASASPGSKTQGCQAGPGCARLRVGARASAAACVSGSAAEPPWRSPPALSRCQLLACPRQSPGSAGRALLFRVRLKLFTAPRSLRTCVAAFPQPSLFSLATWHGRRIAERAYPWRPLPRPSLPHPEPGDLQD